MANKFRTLIFDTEIKGIIITDPDEYAAIMDRGCGGMLYANGWSDYKGMGVACICVWDMEENVPRVFMNAGDVDNLRGFQTYLDSYELLVGFNSVRFDRPLLEANGFTFPERVYEYDILREMWKAEGLNPDKFNPKTHGGYSLDATCEANFGMRKTDGGAVSKDTPRLWQRGEYGKVIDNCLRDVMLTRKLFGVAAMNNAAQVQSFINPKRKGTLKLANPYKQDGWLFPSVIDPQSPLDATRTK